MHTFKRKRVTDEKHLRKLVHYIHFNPVKSRLVNNPSEWEYSSYYAIINPEAFVNLRDKNFISGDKVIDWFGEKENFIYCHVFPPKETGIEDF